MSVNEAIAHLIAAYPHDEFPEPAQKQFRAFLSDFPGEVVLAATLKVIASSTERWRPPIGQIRREAVMLVMPPYPTFSEAWEEVHQNIVAVGSWGKPAWTHPFIGDTVNAIGWRNMCQSTDSLDWRIRTFKSVYEKVVERNIQVRVTLPQVKMLVDKIRSTNLIEKGETMEE